MQKPNWCLADGYRNDDKCHHIRKDFTLQPANEKKESSQRHRIYLLFGQLSDVLLILWLIQHFVHQILFDNLLDLAYYSLSSLPRPRVDV